MQNNTSLPLQVPRFFYCLDVFDNSTGTEVLKEGFNCQTKDQIIWHLERIISKLNEN